MILVNKIDEILPLEGEAGGRLGRHVEHDDRSWGFTQPEFRPEELVSVEWPRQCPIFDQGNIGSCTGNAIAGAIGTDSMWGSGRSIIDKEWAMDLYRSATHLDNIPGHMPPDDTGSSGIAACKAARKAGLIDSYKHAFTLNAALSALQRGPAIVGMTWLTGCDSPDVEGMIDYSGTIRGGHEVLLRGCDMIGSMLFLDNSWSCDWGRNGSFRMTFDAFKIAMGLQGDVTIPIWS